MCINCTHTDSSGNLDGRYTSIRNAISHASSTVLVASPRLASATRVVFPKFSPYRKPVATSPVPYTPRTGASRLVCRVQAYGTVIPTLNRYQRSREASSRTSNSYRPIPRSPRRPNTFPTLTADFGAAVNRIGSPRLLNKWIFQLFSTRNQSSQSLTQACLKKRQIKAERKWQLLKALKKAEKKFKREMLNWLSSLLVTLLVVSVQSAPTMTEKNRMSSSPKWVNPCGLPAALDVPGMMEEELLTDSQLLQQIVLQAKTALGHAQLFRDDFAKRTFKIDFADMHSTFKGSHLDWLPSLNEIPKHLGEQLNSQYLDGLELDQALLDTYEYLQKYAVGLEQIVWDQEDHQLEFRKQFADTEFKLRMVLCEIHGTIAERQVPSRPDVSRSIMPNDYRRLSHNDTSRRVRDWLIFRDYMNALEYVVQVFDHLRHGIQS